MQRGREGRDGEKNLPRRRRKGKKRGGEVPWYLTCIQWHIRYRRRKVYRRTQLARHARWMEKGEKKGSCTYVRIACEGEPKSRVDTYTPAFCRVVWDLPNLHLLPRPLATVWPRVWVGRFWSSEKRVWDHP